MALIGELNRKVKNRQVHKLTDADYDIFINDGQKYLQIDTYGSADREDVGKVSQSIQLNEEVAKQLLQVIKNEFDIEL